MGKFTSADFGRREESMRNCIGSWFKVSVAVRLTALVVVTMMQPAVAAELIVNGTFESSVPTITDGPGREVYVFGTNGTGITGWALQTPGDVYIHQSPDIGNALGSNFNFANDGIQYLDLSGGIGGGTGGNHSRIAQSFATVPSTDYLLSFWVGAAFAPSATINARVDGAGVLLNQTVSATAPGANINWTMLQYGFTADATSATLSFQGLSGADDNVSFVDSVSVTPVPEPGTITLVALAVLAAGRRTWR